MSSSQSRALSLPKTVMLNLYQDDYLLGSIQDLSLGEKSRVGEGDELPRKVRGIHPRELYFETILRNVTVCALTSSRLDDFSDIVTYIL